MKLVMAVQVDAATGEVVAGAVGFDDWAAAEPLGEWTSRLAGTEAPVRGQPDGRPLAGLLHLLQQHRLAPELVVLDGPVHADAQDTPALGRRLHEALGAAVPVVGVARSGAGRWPTSFEVHREEEAAPLWVTCAGLDLGAAKVRVRMMHGRKRVPTLLKRAARLTRPA